MKLAPTSASGPRIEQQGDTLVVTFRARRSGLVFLGIWFTFWTFGGMNALQGLAGPGRLFFAFWLCGWAIGELVVGSLIAWKLAGRELMMVMPNQLAVRKQLGRFAVEAGRRHVLAIEDVLAERVPSAEDEKRTDFRLRIVSSGGAPQFVGEGMDEHVAEHVASVVRSYVRPRPRWGDEGTSPILPLAAAEPAAVDAGSVPWLLRGLLLPAMVGVIALVASGSFFENDDHPSATPRLMPAHLGPPDRRQFDDPGAYAVAMTRYALASGKTKLESAPTCETTATWTRWTCHARGRSGIGPLAGHSLVYRCVAVDDPPAEAAVLCGPERRPPVATR